jgi:polyribonucleotide nucleotidyltransferase
MENQVRVFETTFGGRPLKVEIGRMATLANGSAFVHYGETVVIATATASKKAREGIDFFPLSVDYEEKMYSVGKIPGGFIKREGRPSEKAILTSRLIDRPIRPLFPKAYKNEVQIITTPYSVDPNCPPDIAAMVAVSIALSVSDIPFAEPIGAVIVGLVDGQFIINPTVEQTAKSELHLVVAGTYDAIMMVESGSNILPEKTILDAIFFGHEEIRKIVTFINGIVAECGKPKQVVPVKEVASELTAFIETFRPQMDKTMRIADKALRNDTLEALKDEMLVAATESFPDDLGTLSGLFRSLEKEVVRKTITHEKVRPDGRKLDEIRPISCEVGILPRTHGSGHFKRGLTQVVTIATLGALSDAQRLDGVSLEETKRYMHQYNFPPFSVGETGFMRGPNRRAIGHGALGERALLPVLPSEAEFPYAIRLVSEVVTCNGSSSQASICGSTLSLLDAGVPIKANVAGIAMGLIQEDDQISILSDIQGLEDALGDMDFKVAGTREGITAIQMDIKVNGLTREIMESAVEQARLGRLHILDKMEATISKPAEMSQYAPRVFFLKIEPDKIRDVIGPGGKVINRIIAETGVKIDIEDTGTVLITAPDGISGEAALKKIQDIVKEVVVGEVYTGRITRIMKFGAFVELIPGKEGLVHISQLTKERLEKVEDAFNVGDEVVVKVIEIDQQGRVNLSRKVLLLEEAAKESN